MWSPATWAQWLAATVPRWQGLMQHMNSRKIQRRPHPMTAIFGEINSFVGAALALAPANVICTPSRSELPVTGAVGGPSSSACGWCSACRSTLPTHAGCGELRLWRMHEFRALLDDFVPCQKHRLSSQ